MLLMFGVGLHFSLDDLLSVKKIALPGAVFQMTVATVLGAAFMIWNGSSLEESIIFGISLSVASTVVLLKALESIDAVETINGKIAVGWLIVEDLAMVLALVMLPALFTIPDTAGEIEPLWKTLGLTILQVSAFIALMLIVGNRLFPWILWQVAKTGSRELFMLCVISAAISIAYGAAELFGVSFALGAFFAGMVMRNSEFSHEAAKETLPLREAFSVLFFVSVGMLFDYRILIESPLAVIVTILIIVVGKSLAGFLLVTLFKYPLNTALIVGVGLAQIGEFSFILASLGVYLNVLSPYSQQLILAGAMFSISLNPLLFRLVNPLQQWILSRSTLARLFQRSDDPLTELPMSTDQKYLNKQVVLVGYGKVGSRIAQFLLDHHIPYVVAEQNREIVETLRKKKIPAVWGDAAEPAVLIQAHIARASLLVITTPDTIDVRKMIDTARKLNSEIDISIRINSEQEAELLEAEQAGKVFLAKNELAMNINQHILKQYQIINPFFDGEISPHSFLNR